MNIEGCHALITGASAGIGREFARQLAGRARSIVLVARRRDRLEQLRDELIKRDPKLSVHVREVDLAGRAELAGLTQWLDQQNIEIDLLINNAGLGDMGAFATSDPAKIDRIILVNILALTILTRRLLPAMIKRRRGAILNVSSSAGFLPIAGFSVYAASKAYVTSFSEALRASPRFVRGRCTPSSQRPRSAGVRRPWRPVRKSPMSQPKTWRAPDSPRSNAIDRWSSRGS